MSQIKESLEELALAMEKSCGSVEDETQAVALIRGFAREVRLVARFAGNSPDAWSGAVELAPPRRKDPDDDLAGREIAELVDPNSDVPTYQTIDPSMPVMARTKIRGKIYELRPDRKLHPIGEAP